MNVCAVNGSLRGERGVSHRILLAIRAGVLEVGGTWDEVTLARHEIRACRACDACQRTGACVHDPHDDVAAIFDRIRAADVVVWASPVYVFGPSSLLKKLLERLYSTAPITGPTLSRSGLFFHATDVRLAARPFVSLVVCDNLEDLTVWNTAEFFRVYGLFMDAPQRGHLERRSAALWGAALDAEDPRALGVLEAFVQAGRELGRGGRITRRTRRRAAAPMVHVPWWVRLAARWLPFTRSRVAAEVARRSKGKI